MEDPSQTFPDLEQRLQVKTMFVFSKKAVKEKVYENSLIQKKENRVKTISYFL